MRVFNACLAAVAALTLLATLVLMLSGFAVADNGNQVYQVFFHLKRIQTEETIEKTFQDISTPGNPRYRKFLTYPQLKELVRAPKSIADRASHYLSSEFGCTKVEALKTGDALVCTLEENNSKSFKMAKGVEDAFALREQEDDLNKGIFRIDITNRMPLEIKKLIRYAHAYRQANKMLKPKTLKKVLEQRNREKNLKFAGMEQTPVTINKRYNVPKSTDFPALDAGVAGGVGEFEGEWFKEQSMTTFATRYGLSNYRINIMGGNSPGADATEGTLDLQYLGSIFNNTQPISWLEGSQNNVQPGNIDFSSWIDKVLALGNVPAVISISWGLGDYHYADDMSILATDNDAFKKAGMVGVSLLAASGDSGVGVRREFLQCTKFSPSWPASSAYLTAVGATYADSMSSNEISVDWSGGGFGLSTVTPTPSWQADAVKNYLSTNTDLPKASYFDAKGRGYPDVSALGTNFNIYLASQGSWTEVSGTSAASPTFAGIVTVIAAERKAAGKSALGFLNPTLYQLGKVGYDVVQGQNQDTNCIPFVPIKGFAAQKGWDPVSGLGTPDYQYLSQNL